MPVRTHLNIRRVVLVDDLVRQELRVRLDGPIIEVASDKPLYIEHRVLGVGGGLMLGRVAYQAIPRARVPRDIRRRYAITLIICYDFYVAVFYYSYN